MLCSILGHSCCVVFLVSHAVQRSLPLKLRSLTRIWPSCYYAVHDVSIPFFALVKTLV